MPSRPSTEPFEDLLEYEGFLSILKYYVDLNCFVLPLDPKGRWAAVYHHQRVLSLFDFEKRYGYFRNWEQLKDPKEANSEGPHLVENLGFYDIFAPIWKGQEMAGTLLSGAFADREMTGPYLKASWKKLTGKEGSSENQEFRDFVRTMLETPVLEGEVLRAYQEILGIFTRILAREEAPDDKRRLKELLVGVFSKKLPHSYWMNWVLGLPTRQATPVWDIKIQDLEWIRAEIGLRRIPTTVITVVPERHLGPRYDPLEEMIRIYRFQRRCFEFGKTLPQAVGGKLENYGGVFVLSPDPSKDRLHRKRQVMDSAEKILRFSEKSLGGEVRVGIGRTVTPGEPLWESYRQAVFALHLGRQRKHKIVVLSGSPGEKGPGRPTALKDLLVDLRRAVGMAAFSRAEDLTDEFLRKVLDISFLDPEEIRWHIHYALMFLLEAPVRTAEPGAKTASDPFQEWVLKLEKARTTQEMVLVFKEAVKGSLERAQGSKRSETLSIHDIQDFLDRNFQHSVSVPQLARKAGVSIPTLSRRFKKVLGVGLGRYLQDLRVQEAKELLRNGNLPVAKVAKACGFRSVSYFIRLIENRTGSSPKNSVTTPLEVKRRTTFPGSAPHEMKGNSGLLKRKSNWPSRLCFPEGGAIFFPSSPRPMPGRGAFRTGRSKYPAEGPVQSRVLY